MTYKEFQAWLDGFSESFDKENPNKKQWEKIQKKMKTVTEGFSVCTLPHYPYRQFEYFPWYPNTFTVSDSVTVTTTNTDSMEDCTDTVIVDGDNGSYTVYNSAELELHHTDYAKAYGWTEKYEDREQ